MNKSNLLLIFFLTFIITTGISGACLYYSESLRFDVPQLDTLPENQILYNGRVWQNLYYMVEKDQFLFTKEFLSGSVTINGKTFKSISIKYDIFKDEILTLFDPGGILQLNKEMVDSFSIFFQNKTYQFTRMREDSLAVLKGYVNVIYKGRTALYLKYIKKIDRVAVEGEYDKFYQISRIYFVKDNLVHLITSKSDLLKALNEDIIQLKDFIGKNKLKVSKKVPESFIPVIRYYDSISQ